MNRWFLSEVLNVVFANATETLHVGGGTVFLVDNMHGKVVHLHVWAVHFLHRYLLCVSYLKCPERYSLLTAITQ